MIPIDLDPLLLFCFRDFGEMLFLIKICIYRTACIEFLI
jgi:hypothetical protein